MKGPALKRVVESLFRVVPERSTSNELAFICPEPGCGDATGNRSVNLRTGQCNCWRCNKGGNFVAWARRLGYVLDEDTGDAGSRNLDEINMFSVEQRQTEAVVKDIALPAGFRWCSDYPHSIYTALIGEMAERKNLTLQDLLQAQVGFTKDDPKWEPYALFPVLDYGHVVYWQGRTYVDPPGQSTKRFPDRREAPYGAKYWVYGIDNLRKERSPIVIVVESILNVLSLRRFIREHRLAGVTPVCVFKHYLSAPQARKLLQLDFVREICLLYDHDATRSAWDKSVRLVAKVRTSVAQMPPGPGGQKNDPNDDVVAAWNAFEHRVRADRLTTALAAGFAPAPKKLVPAPGPARIDPLTEALRSVQYDAHRKIVR